MMVILDYPWHQVHSYRLHALPTQFAYVMLRTPLWNTKQRPIPVNFIGGIEADAVADTDYDLALLHLDQWCDTSHNLRGLPYRIMKQITQDKPQVVIMHGTPDGEKNRRAILRLIGDLPVVCNSYQAAEEWDGGEGRRDRYRLPQFRTIIHGYDVDEFWSEPLERRALEIFTICSGGRMSGWYHGLPLVKRLMRDVPLVWYGPRGNRDWLPDYYAYREMLASSLIYFSPTHRAPMPGARTEAMLAGCCVVTVPGNDVERFIEHGKTGFVVGSFAEARDTLWMLLRDPEVAWAVGQAGRAAARELFDKERFVKDWLDVLEEIGVKGNE
jgi:hypothetical protein